MDAFFVVKGVRYQLVAVDDWTFEEAAEAKRIAGMATGRIPQAWIENDPDAIRGVLLVSMRRADRAITESVFAGERPAEIMATLEVVEEPADPEPDPPTAPPSASGGNGGATSVSPTTPAASGIQAGSGVSA